MIVTDDGVVPIGDIDAAIGSHADFDGAEDVVFGFDDVGQTGGAEEAVFVFEVVPFEEVGVVAADEDAALHFFWKLTAVEELLTDLFDRCEAEIECLGIDGEIGADEAGCGVPTSDVGAAFVEGLAVFGGGDAPAVGSCGGPLEEGIEVAGAGAVAPDAGAVQGFDAIQCFDAGVDVMALGEPEFTTEAPVDAVDHLVGVGGAEATEDDALGVGFVIAVGVFEVEEFGALGDVEATVAEFDAAGHEEAFDELVKLVGFAVAVGVLADEDVVVGFFAGFDLGVADGAGDPEAAAFVPAHLDGFDDAIGLGGEEIDGEALHDGERGEFFFGGLRFCCGWLDGDR